VEFGLLALALTLVVVALLAVRIERRPLSDIHLGVACAGLASLALTDFALRITAVALVLAVVVLSSPGAAPPPTQWRSRRAPLGHPRGCRSRPGTCGTLPAGLE
jgi:hypothetical protein